MLSGCWIRTGMDIWRNQGSHSRQPQPGELGVGELDDKGIPETIEGYERLNAIPGCDG